jgi:hypothetical protein
MRPLALPMILLTLLSCSSTNTESVAVKSYDRIENGLIEFTSPEAMLAPIPDPWPSAWLSMIPPESVWRSSRTVVWCGRKAMGYWTPIPERP